MKRRSNTTAWAVFVVIVLSGMHASTSSQGFLGEQRISEECSTHKWLKKHIYVTSVSLVCDSQDYASAEDEDEDENGDDDENSESYTDSLTCRSGDRAKVAVLFDIVRYSGRYDIMLSISSSLFGKMETIRNATDLCNFSNLAYWGGDIDADDLYANAITTPCPLKNGPYSLFTSFTVPSYMKDSYFDITPDIHLEFTRDDKREGRGLIGCVETGTLAEVGFSKSMERRGERFFVLSILIFCLIFACCLLGHRRQREEAARRRKRQKQSMQRRFLYLQQVHSREMDMNHTATTATLHKDVNDGSSKAPYAELT